jgi:hypothetical protein
MCRRRDLIQLYLGIDVKEARGDPTVPEKVWEGGER